MSEQTARLVDRLRARLQQTTRRMTWAELAFGAAVAVGTVAGGWGLAALLEATFWLGTAARTALAAAVGSVTVGVGAALLARPLGRLIGLLPGPSDQEVARKVGNHHPHVADRLVNLLQLAEGERSHAPAPFVDRAVQNLAEDLDDVSFDEVENFGRAQRALRLASLPLAGVLAFLLIAPSTFLNASERLLAPATEFDRPAPFELSVAPGSVRLVRGDSLEITVRARGAAPTEMTLERRTEAGAAPEQISLRPDSTGTFRHSVPTVRTAFEYRVRTAPVQTDWYRVEVARRPLVRRLQLTVTPPSYTGLPSRTLDPNVGDVAGVPGTQVTVEAALGGPSVENARLVFDNDDTRLLEVRDGTARGRFSLQREGTYHLRLESTAGTDNRDPIQYQMSLQSDARPSVRFLQPTGPTDLTDALRQPLRVQLSDDYGFTQAKLYYRLSEQRFGEEEASYSSITLPLPSPGQTSQTIAHEWLLAQDTGLDPQPGDVISYYVQAWDNDTVNGPKSGRTTTQRLRMPSVSEQYDQLNETEEQAGEQMEKLRQRSDSVQQQFQQLRRELRRTREADWQDRQQLQRIQQKQQSMDRGVEKLSKQMQKMNRQMQRNGLSSSDLSKQFQELQRVIEEIQSPELQQALQQLRKAMQNNNLRQMQQSMEKVQKSQESYRKRLDRTLSLFKQLKAQQKLEEMARRAGEMSELQKKLREKTQERMNESAGEQTSAEEQRASEQEKAGKTSSDATQPSADSTREARQQAPSSDSTARSGQQRDGQDPQQNRNRQAGAQQTGGQQQQAQQRAGQNEDLASEQERAAKKMKELQEALQKARQEMKDVQSAPQKQLQQMNQQLQRQNLPQQMQQNSQQLRQNQLQDAQQGQQRMQQSLQKMQKQLSQMKSQMQGQQRQINLAGLRTALENTLRLSKRQESLRTTIDDLAAEGPTLRSYARDQKVLSDGLKTVTDSLESIAERVPQMTKEVRKKSGNALRAMETAMTALDERNASRATGHQKTSMMHLNELAILISDLLEQLQNQQGSGSGMSMQQMRQQLQQMSGQQQKLNQQIQQHLNNVKGQRLTPDQAKRRKELAKQQRRIKQQLQNMEVGSEAKQQIMGDLQKIAEQMEKSAQELDQRRHSRDLVERQQQILTRLLNAQKSLRTQGKQEQRQGRRSEDEYDRNRPGELPQTEEADQLRRDLIRALEMGYSSDYEELIKRYFELLQQEEPTTPADSAGS
ncbi:hypothetical protein BSZ35_14110 [Salinibacter sp. 10B]|uniref:DUF4175 family protein n=1 Tax=Salinibacter sp. 10B TaxID=1923971 RepID=UPI000CF43446|nr:DUF4175 family protein [Salinibacter sp. 10B]PQJ35585.1 hypothetical protein BSZ35_14110 [Salinibacter sp. 10B]